MRSICSLKDVRVFTFALAGMLGALSWPALQARSQTLPSSLPTKEDLARDDACRWLQMNRSGRLRP
jgi:hypothetical protein